MGSSRRRTTWLFKFYIPWMQSHDWLGVPGARGKTDSSKKRVYQHNAKMASSSEEKLHNRGGRRDGGRTCATVRRLGRRRTDGLPERGNRGTVARWEPGGALPPVTRRNIRGSVAPSRVPGYLGLSGYLVHQVPELVGQALKSRSRRRGGSYKTQSALRTWESQEPGEEAESDNGTFGQMLK